jgi:hypothetical protein
LQQFTVLCCPYKTPLIAATLITYCLAEVVQTPPADGAVADTGMMPPEGDYDHPPMDGGMTMPEPNDYGDGYG